MKETAEWPVFFEDLWKESRGQPWALFKKEEKNKPGEFIEAFETEEQALDRVYEILGFDVFTFGFVFSEDGRQKKWTFESKDGIYIIKEFYFS